MLSLSGEWALFFAPEVGGRHDRLEDCPLTSWRSIPAKVPGNVELDLMRAGLEDDPFYDVNLHRFAKYEYAQWFYRRAFDAPAEQPQDGRVMLELLSIDTVDDIHLNYDPLQMQKWVARIQAEERAQ